MFSAKSCSIICAMCGGRIRKGRPFFGGGSPPLLQACKLGSLLPLLLVFPLFLTSLAPGSLFFRGGIYEESTLSGSSS